MSEMAAVSSVLRDVAVGLIELALPDARPYVNESYKEVLIDMGADFSPQNTAEWNRLFEVRSCALYFFLIFLERP